MCRHENNRKGAILVLAAFLMVMFFAFIAFSIDLGYLGLVRTDLQRAADSAAIASAWDIVEGNSSLGKTSVYATDAKARATAADYVTQNAAANLTTTLAADDIVIGRLASTADGKWTVQENSAGPANAVRVRIRRTTEQNGEVPLFFARVLGIKSRSMQAEAIAAFMDNIDGFQLPSDSTLNVNLLPFALDKETWDAMLQGVGQDQWAYDAATGEVKAGSDGILEVNLYPQGTGSPGNRGTVDIGNPNNSTKDLSRQIRDGISAKDLEYVGGKIELNSEGKLYLNADTGISAGVKDDLAAIIGKPRIIPLFSKVTGNGNNATYEIVQFVGIRILEVKLTGSMNSKRVMIQPANVTAIGGMPAKNGQTTSTYVHSTVHLVQ